PLGNPPLDFALKEGERGLFSRRWVMAMQDLDEEAIFNRARLIAPPEERASYLHQVCGTNETLRARVQALLQVYDLEQSFLAAPALGGGPAGIARLVAEGPGTKIGPYKLLQQIGEGGMGTVWMAEQTEPVQRKVALKIVKPGLDSAQVVARFEAE